MKKIFAIMILLVGVMTFTSCGDDEIVVIHDYDILQINGEKYACYGYRCAITFTSTWDLSRNQGEILLPCGKFSDAEKGNYYIDYMFTIQVEGGEKLKKGSKLENFSLTFDSSDDYYNYSLEYVNGSATVTDKKDNKYLTIRFDSLKFGNAGKSYTLNGTVQLDLDEV